MRSIVAKHLFDRKNPSSHRDLSLFASLRVETAENYFATNFCFSRILTSRSTQAWSISSKYSAERRSAILAVLRRPSMKFTASKLISAKFGLVARPSESLAKRASCSASHLLSSAAKFSKADASRGRRRFERSGPAEFMPDNAAIVCDRSVPEWARQSSPSRLVTQLLLVVKVSKLCRLETRRVPACRSNSS